MAILCCVSHEIHLSPAEAFDWTALTIFWDRLEDVYGNLVALMNSTYQARAPYITLLELKEAI